MKYKQWGKMSVLGEDESRCTVMYVCKERTRKRERKRERNAIVSEA